MTATTFREARATLRAKRVRLTRTGHGAELRVSLDGARPGEGYFTDDLQDALDTGRHMAAERDGKRD